MGKNWLAAVRAQWLRTTHHEEVFVRRRGLEQPWAAWAGGADAGLSTQSVIHFSTGRLQMTVTDRNE
jgi:hypothetical protein